MSAKSTNLGRVQEIFDVITQTRRQIKAIGLTKEAFLEPVDDAEDLIAEGIMNRVLRITEEAGRIDDETAIQYGFDSAGARGVRNRLAHVYGDVDKEIIWQVVEEDFETLLRACRAYCDDEGVELALSRADRNGKDQRTGA